MTSGTRLYLWIELTGCQMYSGFGYPVHWCGFSRYFHSVVLAVASLSSRTAAGTSLAASSRISIMVRRVSGSFVLSSDTLMPRYRANRSGAVFSMSLDGMTVWTSALSVSPRNTGRASRPTNRKIRNTIAMAERLTVKMNFSAIHSSGRALCPRWMPIQPEGRFAALA